LKPIFLSCLSALFFFSQIAFANADLNSKFDAALDDLMSPDEIAVEAGFPRTEVQNVLRFNSADEIEHIEGIDLYKSFPLVLVVNKREAGLGAQRISVYENGVKTQEWKVSTGRERWERAKSGRRYFSVTPLGWYYPKSIIRDHWSNTWEAKMEFAVFFNGGVALHATTPDHYKELGARASGGCVRMEYKNAEYVYNRILAEGRGLVPYVQRDGSIQRDRRGNPRYTTNWKTLIAVVE
jgi:hypothetical protein